MNEKIDREKFSKEISRLPETIYGAKRNALVTLAEIYSKDNTSNLACFVDKVSSKIKDDKLSGKIKMKSANMSKDELLKILDKCLSENYKEILIKRYKLDEDIKVFGTPVSMEDIAREMNTSYGAIASKEKRALNTLASVFVSL